MNINDSKLLQDLEIDEKVFPTIDKTVTAYGQAKLREMFQVLVTDHRSLDRRSNLLQTILSNLPVANKIIDELKKVSGLEKDVEKFFTEDDNLESMYFKRNIFNVTELLNVKHTVATYSPLFMPIMYLIIYCIMRHFKLKISIAAYFKGIYNRYIYFVKGMLTLAVKNQNFVSLLTNVIVTAYIVYQMYIMYSQCDTAYNNYNKCQEIKETFTNIRKLLLSAKTIYQNDIFLVNEKQVVADAIKELDKVFVDKPTVGIALTIKRNSDMYEEKFNMVLQYIGIIDSLISIVRLVIEDGYIFPIYDFGKELGPYIEAKGMWNPYYDVKTQVLNNCQMGKPLPNTFIITGANTSGKSTFIRNACLSIFMAQTLGISPCISLRYTPVNHIFTYIDIPNAVRTKESLFEAEIKRCMEFCKVIEDMANTDSYSLTVIDELFTGTNPSEGVAGSYGVCDYLGRFPNSLMIITTHFFELTELGDSYPELFSNKKFDITVGEDGTFNRSYKMRNGVSTQRVAIELLKQKNYNNAIIDKALKKLNNIST